MAFKDLQEEGLGHFIGKYRIWLVSTGIVDELPASSSVMGPSQGCTQFLKRRSKKGGGEVCGREEEGYFRIELC